MALKWGLIALAVILVIFFLARSLSIRRRKREEEDIEEVTESLWSWEGFMKDLRSFLATLLKWFRWRKRVVLDVASPPIASLQETGQARLLSVREMYQGLLWEGRRAGVPRREPETPYEYQAKLEGHVPTGTAEVRAITEAYVADRYGGAEISSGRLAPLNRLWLYLRSVLRRGNDMVGQEPD